MNSNLGYLKIKAQANIHVFTKDLGMPEREI
jgi:hypothetical protein